jgi:glutathione-regulated potassium-efflux system protein KefB
MAWRQALGLGLLLSQGGEFGFVLFAQAQNALLIAPEAASLFGAIVTLSMATTPFLMMLTSRFRADAKRKTDALDTPRNDGANALVVGYGRFGQTVAQMLIGQGISVTLIDRSPDMIDTAGTFGMKVYYGDGTRLDLLRQAGAADAQLLLFCLDGDALDAEFLTSVHHSFPNATIYARAFDRRSVMKMRGAPIAGAVREVFESAVIMARKAMDAVGVDAQEIDRTETEYRRRDYERLAAQKETGDLYASSETMFSQESMAAQADVDAGNDVTARA